jgi:uncharacterized radical SAM superfamily protein
MSLKETPPELLEAAGMIRDIHQGRVLRFYYPLPRFPNISVTGTHCALNCKHCGGHYLSGMSNVDTPKKLRKFCSKLDEDGGIGVLVSGGSNVHGRVPLKRFYSTLRWVKENTGLIVNLHTGLLDSKEADEIASTGIDIVSVDVVGSNETIRRVYGITASISDYEKTLKALIDSDVPHIVPHICVGLDFGKMLGEVTAMKIIKKFNPEQVVILALIPTQNTPMQDIVPPSVEDVARTVATMKLMCHRTSISIGCMRPRIQKTWAEELAIRAGADRIVLPSRSTVAFAKREGFKIKHLDGCCSIPLAFEHRALGEYYSA